MADIVTKQCDRGYNGAVVDASELKRGSADDGSQNVLYSRNNGKTPFGFAKVESGSLPLDSGSEVLFIGTFAELDKTQHTLSITRSKIYDRDFVNSQWDDVTQNGQDIGGSIYTPMSIASILHTDGLALNGSGDDAFHHALVCDGSTAIQRWAGKRETDFADLVGAGGYHHTDSGRTTHYADQVGVFFNRAILVNTKEADANNNLVENNQRIRWPQAGKLEIWTGQGSGRVDLLDAGGHNIRGALLGKQWIQYQNNSIWSLTYVGGTRVFEPDIEVPDLGLLAPHLLFSKNKIHYFVGNDYNIYAYTGGSGLKNIGINIRRFFDRDLRTEFQARCWLRMGAKNSRLWLFIVPTGQQYCTQAYAIDIRTGSWMKRDFTHVWTDSASGITSVSLAGASTFFAGKTYGEVLNVDKSPAKVIAVGGCVRATNVVTVTTTTAHGWIVGETVVLSDVDTGGETDAFSGSFTVASKPSTTTFTHAQTGANEANLAEGSCIVDKAPTYQDAENDAETYREAVQETQADETLMLGDSNGNVYQYDADLTTDNGVNIPATHITEVYDLGAPTNKKLWPAFFINAKGDGIIVSYRTGNFQTTGTGWTVIGTLTLTSEFLDYYLPINDTSEKIQFMFTNANGDTFEYSNYGLSQPAMMGRI